jgi:chitodextrinase
MTPEENARRRILIIGLAAAGVVAVVLVLLFVFVIARPHPPVARIDVSPFVTPWTSTPVTFDASLSAPGIAPGAVYKERYEWDFGDGTTATGKKVTHQFSATGVFEVSLDYEVADTRSRLRRARAVIPLAITDSPLVRPLSIIASPSQVPMGQRVKLQVPSAQLASSRSDLRWQYDWDFGDESPPVQGDTPEHVYSRPDAYTVKVTVTVTDGSGRQAQREATSVIQVRNPDLPIKVNPKPNDLFGDVVAQRPVSFVVNAAGAEDRGNILYAWQFTEGAAEVKTESPFVTYASGFPQQGKYLVKLQVWDEYQQAHNLSPQMETFAVEIGPSPAQSPFVLSGGLTTLGDLQLWSGAAGLSIPGTSLTLAAGYAMNTERVEIDRTHDWPNVEKLGGFVKTTISEARLLTAKALYNASYSITLGITAGVLSLEGEHTASCRCKIGESDRAVPFTETAVVLGLSVGYRIGFGLLSFELLFAL